MRERAERAKSFNMLYQKYSGISKEGTTYTAQAYGLVIEQFCRTQEQTSHGEIDDAERIDLMSANLEGAAKSWFANERVKPATQDYTSVQ